MIKKIVFILIAVMSLPACVIYLDDDSQYLERHQKLTMPAETFSVLAVNNKAGNVIISGEHGRTDIEVQAIILTQAEDDVVVSLERSGSTVSVQEDIKFYRYHNKFPVVHLTIRVPQHFSLELQDGSGNITITGLQGDLSINDGSGNVVVHGAHNVRLVDGSGNLEVVGVSGDVDINDGSGNLVVEQVGGTVTIRDGSGNIVVKGVGDLNIVSSGSGRVVTRDIGQAGIHSY